ncbi:hypothetical protein [Inhella gelatinilytica]|uniref:Lipoprotein n=1 Tax=Inhella gelatinilytica TaxID=2795030 RepID=A0A931ISX4_9BURK|nr:hypothetical protein [Inhella gelatinilytica]MBH9552127.1 hypothetical protein [Inhella gelatinilytica]
MTYKIALITRYGALCLWALLAACGGGDEPRVTVLTTLPKGADYLIVPGSASALQAQLSLDRVPFENPRCADWQRDPRPGKGVSWVEGVSPVYLLLDVPESSAPALKQKYGLEVYDPAEHLSVVLPFFDCKARGY